MLRDGQAIELADVVAGKDQDLRGVMMPAAPAVVVVIVIVVVVVVVMVVPAAGTFAPAASTSAAATSTAATAGVIVVMMNGFGGVRGLMVWHGGTVGRWGEVVCRIVPVRDTDIFLMPMPLVISLVGLCILSAGLGVYWGVVLGHVVRTSRRVPTARAGLSMTIGEQVPGAGLPGASLPSVCVVVPAHNEEASIAGVARALLAQDYAGLRVVFALDRCTDGTRRVLESTLAGDARAEIVEISSCPEDWAGKVHAIWRGVQDSAGAKLAGVLVFLDADTRPKPECVRACVGLLQQRGLALLSLLSTMTGEAWFDRVVEPAAGMELIRQYPLERANEPDASKRRAFANGQFIMITKDAYQRIGGHERVRHALLEDIEIAREVARAGLAAGMYLADGLHECRMYESWTQFQSGWERIYIESCNRRPERLRAFAVRVRVTGVWMPLASIVCIAIGLLARRIYPGDPLPMIALGLGIAGLVMMFIGLLAAYRMSRTPMWAVVGYPIGAWMTGTILRNAAETLRRGGKTRWGGREYVLRARE